LREEAIKNDPRTSVAVFAEPYEERGKESPCQNSCLAAFESLPTVEPSRLAHPPAPAWECPLKDRGRAKKTKER